MKTEETFPDPEELRELARRIQEEMDPNRMIELVRQLIAGFDKQQERRKAQLREQGGAINRPVDAPTRSSTSEGADGA
jgi:hypothetical protein